ncbi:MAG: WYL domain-containing protein [Caldilineales bacterium]|nr:WYL domain-containing protein [Caldilineales bacterium]
MNGLPDLRTCLEGLSWRYLRVLMAAHDLRLKPTDRKADLVRVLAVHLSRPEVVADLFLRLEPNARQVLAALLQQGGALPAHTVAGRFGALAIPPAARQADASSVTILLQLGLVFLWPSRPQPGERLLLVIPAELHHVLAARLPGPAIVGWTPCERPGHPADADRHMAVLLVTLAAESIRLLLGYWLPPTAVRLVADRLGLSVPAGRRLRSERHLPYLAFLHHLAAAAGWLEADGCLTPAAWRWLEAPPEQRWEMLWQACRQKAEMLPAARYFAWAALPTTVRDAVTAHLATRPVAEPLDHTAFLTALRLTDADDVLRTTPDEAVVAWLTGPLFWLGLLDRYEGSDGRPYFALTRRGAWLLGRPGYGPPAFPPPAPCRPDPDDPTRLRWGLGVLPAHPARLAPFCRWETSGEAEPLLALDGERVAAAVAAGRRLSELFGILHAACGRPPSRSLQAQLRVWAARGQAVRIREVVLLETAEPQLMADLRRRKRIRRHLGEALAPTRVVVNPDALPAVQAQLRDLGWVTHLPTASASSTGDNTVNLAVSTATALYTAALVYQGLAEHVALPVPAESLDALAGRLTPVQRAAAAFYAEQVLADLEAALRGYLALPAWVSAGEATDVLSTLEAALAAKADVVITYAGAGREATLVRRVTPYWLEEHRGVYYLVAYCHLRHEERVFRVDRILKCTWGDVAHDGSLLYVLRPSS